LRSEWRNEATPLPCGRADPTMQIGRPRTQTWTFPNTTILMFIVASLCGVARLAQPFLSRLRSVARKFRKDATPITGARTLS
jgi:hypothetical protein